MREHKDRRHTLMPQAFPRFPVLPSQDIFHRPTDEAVQGHGKLALVFHVLSAAQIRRDILRNAAHAPRKYP